MLGYPALPGAARGLRLNLRHGKWKREMARTSGRWPAWTSDLKVAGSSPAGRTRSTKDLRRFGSRARQERSITPAGFLAAAGSSSSSSPVEGLQRGSDSAGAPRRAASFSRSDAGAPSWPLGACPVRRLAHSHVERGTIMSMERKSRSADAARAKQLEHLMAMTALDRMLLALRLRNVSRILTQGECRGQEQLTCHIS